ncbi:hypothetical protein CR513_19083, partial [Mucuna pruriens]
MTRSSSNNLHDLDPERDRTLHRLRKIKNTDVGSSDSFNSISNSVNNSFATNSEFPDCSNNNGELRLNIERVGHAGCGVPILGHLLEPAQSYELKFGLIHLLPKFHDHVAPEGISHGVLHDEAAEDSGGLYKDEGVPIFPRWSNKGLAIPITDSFPHLGRYETYISEEVLPDVQNCNHPEGNMWDQATLKRNPARILGEI